jgi:hypothetical protein
VPEGPTWQEQYERTKRWYWRVAATSDVTDDMVDEFYAFFVFCWHLKDWLKADLEVSAPIRAEVETFVNGNLWLRLCADLANGVKHLKLDHRARFDIQARVEITMSEPAVEIMEPGLIATSVAISLDGVPYNPGLVARKCMNAWNTFLGERGLVTDGGEYR